MQKSNAMQDSRHSSAGKLHSTCSSDEIFCDTKSPKPWFDTMSHQSFGLFGDYVLPSILGAVSILAQKSVVFFSRDLKEDFKSHNHHDEAREKDTHKQEPVDTGFHGKPLKKVGVCRDEGQKGYSEYDDPQGVAHLLDDPRTEGDILDEGAP